MTELVDRDERSRCPHRSAFAAFADRLARIAEDALVRLDRDGSRCRVLAILPTGSLVGQSIRAAELGPEAGAARSERVTTARGLRDWVESGRPFGPAPSAWLVPLPPQRGWQRIEVVPASVVRELVQAGIDAHRTAAERGLGSAAANSLLDTVVLTIRAGRDEVGLTNRTLAGLSSMGFLGRAEAIAVSVQGRWTRLATELGSAFVANRSDGLQLV